MSTEVTLEPIPADLSPGTYRKDVYQPAGYVLPRTYRPHYSQVLELPIYDDDVWVVSHPKSGTTWTTEMVWLLRNNHDFNAAKQYLEERVPFFEYSALITNRLDDKQAEEHKKSQPLVFADSVRYVAEMPGPRTIKTHLHWNLLPRALRRPESKAKIIYVAREAKDVCVSFYYHSKLIYNISESLEEYANHFLGDRLMFAPFWKHVLEFWRLRDRENILFLRYADMKKDLPSVIRQVNGFLGLPPLSDQEVEKLNIHLSFHSMKNNKAVNAPGAILRAKSPDERGDGHFIRKGIVGDWKEKMSPDLVQRFDEWTEKQTRGSGLKL